MLSGKKILIGITGSIAAYKSIVLTRLLIKEGAEVRIILTPSAKQFVSPLVLSTLSNNAVLIELSDELSWSNHVMLGRWADVFLIAPASCNTLAKMSNGLCDNLLLAVYLSATCPVVIAPAMDDDMWHHSATKKNIQTLSDFGNYIIPVANGELGSGLIGDGRMAEPEDIVQYLKEQFFRTTELIGKRVMITAGPTYEAMDPVRFIGNHSSGKMGFAIAEAFYTCGADVTIVSGPVNIRTAFKGIKVVSINSSDEMFEASTAIASSMDILLMCAAVADYKPAVISETKIKKEENDFNLSLTKTKDILKYLGNNKLSHQFIAGFALETNDEKKNAIIKLKNKNADCIFLNSLNNTNQVFGSDKNKITILSSSGEEIDLGIKTKNELAENIVSYIISKIYA